MAATMSSNELLTTTVGRIAVYAGAVLVLYLAVTAPVFQQLLATPGPALAATALLCAALVLLSAIDIETHLLPDAITLPLIAVGLILAAKNGNVALGTHAAAAAGAMVLLWCVAAGYRRWRGRDGLGLGDAKLFAAAAAWLGPVALPSVLAYAVVAALVAVVLGSLRGSPVGLTTRIPFGPYLAFAIWLVWLYGPIEIATEW